MPTNNTFNDVLESVDKLTLDEQETLSEVLHRCLIERRRAELAREIREAEHEFQEGLARPVSLEEL